MIARRHSVREPLWLLVAMLPVAALILWIAFLVVRAEAAQPERKPAAIKDPVKLAFAPRTLERFRAAEVSKRLKDGGVPGLMVVTVERELAEQMLAVLAVELNYEVKRRKSAVQRP
jgi:hypothetical protein